MALFGTNATPEEDWMGAVSQYGLEEATRRYPYQAKIYGTPLELVDQQIDILKQQQDIFNKSYEQSQLLQPLLLEQAGIIAQYDDEGNITGYKLAPATESPEDIQAREEQALIRKLSIEGLRGQLSQQENINKLTAEQYSQLQANAPLRAQTEAATLERTLAALEGRLPVDPTLMDELTLEEEKLNERYLRQLGPGYESSSPYTEAKDRFLRTKEAILNSARRGEITSLGQLGYGMGESNIRAAYGAPQTGLEGYAARQSAIDSLFGRTNAVASSALPYGSAYGSAVAGLNSPLSHLEFDKQMAFQAYQAQEASKAQIWSGIFGGLGQIGGMYLGSKWFGSGKKED